MDRIRLLFAAALVAAACAAAPALAQESRDGEFEEDEADSAQTEGLPAAGVPAGGLAAVGRAAAADSAAAGGFWFSNTPKSGVKADVRQFGYYSELATDLGFAGGSFSNTAAWSWDEYRKQDKTLQKRTDNFLYTPARTLPVGLAVTGTWDWSEDMTVNTAGFANLSKRDVKAGALTAEKTGLVLGPLVNSLKTEARLDDQKSENQGQRNDFQEASLGARLQSGWRLADGVTVAGRAYGKTTAGDRYLGNASSPSSASADSLGLGVYYARGSTAGRVAVTRSNFDREYLDFRKNSSGLIDTVGLAEQDKVVSELESNDATSIELENTLHVGRMQLGAKFGRTVDDVDYRVSLVGLKERQQDSMDLSWGVGVGRDSIVVAYRYLWRWDDQRIKGATASRGRQYTKSRNCDVTWYRTLFAATRMTMKFHEGLDQDIAENVHNQNDKDRQQTDYSVRLERDWPFRFRTTMIFAFKESGDIAIRESRSSNNSIKDSYEITPGYLWTVAPWLTWDQNYQVFIQYTDYVYSGLETVNRDDNYNKRGNLATKVTVKPTRRLDLTVRHEYNRRFNATATATDAGGNTFYHKDVIQTISKISFALVFRPAAGVTVEGATYQTEDLKDSFGRVQTETRTASGEVWLGTKISQRFGQGAPGELSAMVKRYYAYGPSVNETSADYWEADVWLKWRF